VRLYGHERNLMTSSIARMNCFLHGIEDLHVERVAAYRDFTDVPGFARAVPLTDIRAKDGELSIPLYVAQVNLAEQKQASYGVEGAGGLDKALGDWLDSSRKVRGALEALLAGGSQGR